MKYELKDGFLHIHIDEKFHQKTITQFFDSYYISSKNRYLYIQEQTIQLNQEIVKDVSTRLQKDDLLTIRISEQESDYLPAPQECLVVYEDDFVYVAHKPAGIIVHGEKNDFNSFACQAAAYQKSHQIHQSVRYIHRLDRETTGLILCVKVPFFQPWYDEMLKQKKIQRHYYAIISSKQEPKNQFQCHAKIGKDRHINGKFRVSLTGKEASTHFKTIKRIGNYSCIECSLETGRTHQIRVHLSHLKLPIVNDKIYGIISRDFKEMGLWAQKIIFSNPLTNAKCIAVDIPNPDYRLFFKK